MAKKTERLRRFLIDVERMVRLQLDALEIVAVGDPTVESLRFESDQLFKTILTDGFHLRTTEFDEMEIRLALVQVSTADMADTQTLASRMRDVFAALGGDHTSDLTSRSFTFTDPSIINQEIVGALRTATRRTNETINALQEQGADLFNDDHFFKLQDAHEIAKKAYRDALKSNAITGTESDVLSIDNLGIVIQESTTKEQFFTNYSSLTAFMESKVS